MTAELVILAGVICDIYDAAIDPTLWVKALQSSCEFVGGLKANLFWQDKSASVATLHQFNNDPHFTRLYVEVYAALNPIFPAAIARPVGSVSSVNDLMPMHEFLETRFYKEWVAPQGLGDSIGVLLDKDQNGAAFLAFEITSPVADQAAKARAALLVPHYQRAVAIGRMFSGNETTSAFAQTLDHIDAGVFLVAADSRIVFANTTGRRMLEDGRILNDARGRLAAPSSDADRNLTDGIRAIANDSPANGGSASVVLSEDAGVRWTATVLPLTDGARRQTGETHHAIAAVFVRQSIDAVAAVSPLDALAKTYRLTTSEVRVVEAMLRISGLDAIANALGISRATVKTHLNRVYRKSGAKNQGDLIRLVAGLGADT